MTVQNFINILNSFLFVINYIVTINYKLDIVICTEVFINNNYYVEIFTEISDNVDKWDVRYGLIPIVSII